MLRLKNPIRSMEEVITIELNFTIISLKEGKYVVINGPSRIFMGI